MRDLLEERRAQAPQVADALLNPLLAYLVIAREVAGGDLDRNIILLAVAIRAIEHPEFAALPEAARLDRASVFPTLGVNTSSIAESSGIPRETVRRKVADLVRRGWIARDGANLHFTGGGFGELTRIREARERLAMKYYEIIRSGGLEPTPA
jgi:hypothetical protein